MKGTIGGIMKTRFTTAVFVAILSSACSRAGLGVHPESPAEVDPTTPVYLRADAATLKNRAIEAVSVEATETVADMPLTAGLIRKTAERVGPAVVSIYTKTETPYTIKLLPGRHFGKRFTVPGEALGSAFFIHPDGYLITNNHVIENAVQVTAQTQEGKDYPVRVAARDPVLDLALLKIDGDGTPFPALPMGRSGDVGVGDVVIAVGNPLGLGHTVTHGIISQTSRTLSPSEDPDAPGRRPEFLQTDTAVNPGSSGGPLITLTGAWVGVNTAVLLGTQGIFFAVPASQVKAFLQTVLKGDGVIEP
jgi:serine protease Do